MIFYCNATGENITRTVFDMEVDIDTAIKEVVWIALSQKFLLFHLQMLK